MDIENAEIVQIGEIQKSQKGRDKILIHVRTLTEGRKPYLILRHDSTRFDLIRRIEHGWFKVGDTISFNFNKCPFKNGYDTIWKMRVRE